MTHFDATDLEDARRAHDYEMGAESDADRHWSRFYEAARAAIVARGWDERFADGTSRGLDGCDAETGYSIDGAYEAWKRGWSVGRYMAQIATARAELRLQ